MQVEAIVFKLVGLAIAVFFIVSGAQLALHPARTYRKWYQRALVWPEPVEKAERGRFAWLGIRVVGVVFACGGLASACMTIYAIVAQSPMITSPQGVRSTEHAKNLPTLVIGLFFFLGGIEALIWPAKLVSSILGKASAEVQQEEERLKNEKRFRALGLVMVVVGMVLVGVYLLNRFA